MTLTKEHFSPRGYLRGFIKPSRPREAKPLWVRDVQRGRWEQKSPAEIGYEFGFYQPPPGVTPMVDFERLFRNPERVFPLVRDRIRSLTPEVWTSHRRTLVGFAALLATRSPLFLAQAAAAAPVGTHTRFHALSQMESELRSRPFRWFSLNWGLRYVQDPDSGLPTGDQPVVVEGQLPSIEKAFSHHESIIMFPVSWDMLLLGSAGSVQPLTAPLHPYGVEHVRDRIRESADRFFVSPVPLFG